MRAVLRSVGCVCVGLAVSSCAPDRGASEGMAGPAAVAPAPGASSRGGAEPASPAPAGPAPRQEPLAGAVTGSPALAATGPAAPRPRAPGADFASEARRLFRVAACGGAEDVPARFARAAVDRHCERMNEVYARYRSRWLSAARPFFEQIRPPGLPRTVVYPFGGGDLVTALAVFPDAERITTLSLEPAGDVRNVDVILPARLPGALRVNGHNLRRLLGISYSNTINLGRGRRASLPGEIVMLLGALAVHGLEPTRLRYFRFGADGEPAYLSEDEVRAEAERTDAAPEGAGAAFANVELGFRPRGDAGPERFVRHVAQDLSDAALGSQGGLLAHLERLGTISVMTKAASHLLWSDEFLLIRNYVLKHAAWMVSDSTGVPPRFARASGFVQDTYGVFRGPARYGPIEALDAGAFLRLFAEQPTRPLPFKFGYGDVGHRSHLVVMRRP